MRPQRQHQIRPTLVLMGVLILGGCTSAIVREVQLIHRLVIPSSPGDGSMISTRTDATNNALWSTRAARTVERGEPTQAIVPDALDPNDP